MSAIYLREDDVEQLIDMAKTIEVTEDAFLALAENRAVNVPRTRAKASGIVLHSMSAAADYLGTVGWKQYTTTRAGARFLVGIYDQATGSLLALIEANRLGQLRTGAATGVAAKWLAPEDATEVGLIGSGFQAETQLAALASVRPLQRAYVYSRTKDKRESFATRMGEQLALEVIPVSTAEEAARERPLVVTATSSRTPVLKRTDLTSDAFVAAIGCNWPKNAELDAECVRSATAVVCDSVEGCRIEAGELLAAVEAGVFSWEKALELSSIVSGEVTVPRTGVLFKSVGMAIQDVAVATWLWKTANARGIGQSLPF